MVIWTTPIYTGCTFWACKPVLDFTVRWVYVDR